MCLLELKVWKNCNYIYIYLSRNRPIYGTIPIQIVQADNIENVHTYIYIYNLLLLYTSWKSKIV